MNRLTINRRLTNPGSVGTRTIADQAAHAWCIFSRFTRCIFSRCIHPQRRIFSRFKHQQSRIFSRFIHQQRRIFSRFIHQQRSTFSRFTSVKLWVPTIDINATCRVSQALRARRRQRARTPEKREVALSSRARTPEKLEPFSNGKRRVRLPTACHSRPVKGLKWQFFVECFFLLNVFVESVPCAAFLGLTSLPEGTVFFGRISLPEILGRM